MASSPALAGEKNGVGLEKISLPSGPGSIEGLGDAFEPQLNTGTSSYSIKIASPPGVAGLQPNVVLRYNSGGGNGHYGIAWNDGLMSIQRQTEKGLPTYGPNDRFTLGGEELVPLTDGSYRAENESAFQRVRRSGSGWEVTDKKGTRWLLGTKAPAVNPSRILRPGGSAFDDTFKWCVDEVIDVHGNRKEFHYQTFADSPGDIYCAEIRYSIFGGNYHSIFFDFEPRPDAFSHYLSGFEVRTGRRCYQIRVVSSNVLVRRYGLAYELPANDPVEIIAPTDTGGQFSLLRQVTQFDRSGGSANFLPPLRLGYTRFDAAQAQRGAFQSPSPYSLGNPNLALVDLNCDSLPDFLYTDPVNGRHSVIYNEGLGRFSPEYLLANVPTGTSLGNATVQLADYDGDGRVDLILKAGISFGVFSYFPNTTRPTGNDDKHPSWGAEVTYGGAHPPFELSDPSVRTLDLDGDKRMDFMRTTKAGFIYYYNRGTSWEEDGLYLFGEPKMGDITYADGLTFDQSGQSNVRVKLADMNGDRLLDLVRLNTFGTQLEVTFWPNKGRGAWGSRQVMAGAIELGVVPVEDVFVMDINGDGLADIVAVAVDKVSYWVNLGNGAFSRRLEVANTPTYIRGQTVLRQADINGNGSTDFLWENFDPGTGAWRIEYVDFIGNVKPNLLRVIDNGIGLQTWIEYKTSTDFYVADRRGANPWRTRLPFPVQVVSRITKTFGLDLDAVPGEDRYITDFSYFDGYYDTFEKEFRGFAFARKVERGDDQQGAAEVNSPSTVTRFMFHTGVPDGLDNNGDNRVDEFDPISGYEEEALKGKVLWTEIGILTAGSDGVDSDGDGFVDESDEGAFAGQPSPDAVVFSREINTWQLKTIHAPSGVPANTLQPFNTTNGQKVTYAFLADVTKSLIELGSAEAAVTRTESNVDFFGNPTFKKEHGVVSGGPLASYDDERVTTTAYAYNLNAWIVGNPSEENVTDEGGAFVARTRSYYDDQGLGVVGSRGLLTRQERFITVSASVATATAYDGYGNPTRVRDPNYGTSPGHERRYGYDATFHTFVEKEEIETGSTTLVAEATYDFGGGVLTTAKDFNGNPSTFQYDSFFRLVGIVKPGDSATHPTQMFAYKPGDTVRKLVYDYTSAGDLSLSVSGAGIVVSSVSVKSREQAGGGTFDIYQITDGAGHKLGTIEEGVNASQWVYKNLKRYTSRGAERDSYLPFYGGSPDFVAPPLQGDRTTMFYDALGRGIRTVNPPETVGGPRKASRTEYRPLKTVLFDEEDNDPSSPHFNTPHTQYQDGLGRLVGVDEINKENGNPVTYPTRYAYDLNDQLVRITDSQNNVKIMQYDGLKRFRFMDDPDRGVMTYTYDDASNLTETLDAKNQRIVMTYDGANRILTEDYLDARGISPDVTYSYDLPLTIPVGDGTTDTTANPRGKLVNVVDLSGGETLSYDARGRTAWKVKRIPDPKTGIVGTYQSRYTYDSLDRLTVLGYPDGDSVTHTYNNRNLPETIIGGPSGFIISGMSYKASGQLDSTTYGNGVATSYEYDPRLRLRALNTAKAATQLISFAYQFDGASNITRIDDNRAAISAADPRKNTQVFGYDDLYRLTSVQYPALLGGSPGSIGYAYDRVGNMLTQGSNIAATENALPLTNLGSLSYGGTAGASGRLGRSGGQPGPHALTAVSGGSRTYPYDANGNMETIDGMACTWDFKDRLVAVENAQMRADYSYDYTDRRIVKKVFPKTNGVASTKPTAALYVDRTFEIREDSAPTKYVWNGETRVARVATNLNATLCLQRFRLQTGWNVCALAVALTNAGTQLGVAPVAEVYRYDTATQTYAAISPTEAIPAGTLLRVRASAAAELAVRGMPAAAASVGYPAGRHWIGNATFQPLDLATALPADALLWFWQAGAQAWRCRLPAPLSTASDAPAVLEPGEAIFALHTAAFTVSPTDPTLEIRFYHRDHLGSSSVMTDATGQLISESSFYPFGHPRSEHEPRNTKELYGFTQKERDNENGLNYFEARFLSSGLARFVSVDCVALGVETALLGFPQYKNPYAYARSRPLVFDDQDGRFANLIVGALLGAAADAAGQIACNMIKGQSLTEAVKGIDPISVGLSAVQGALTSGASAAGNVAKAFGKEAAESMSKSGLQIFKQMAVKAALKETAENVGVAAIAQTVGIGVEKIAVAAGASESTAKSLGLGTKILTNIASGARDLSKLDLGHTDRGFLTMTVGSVKEVRGLSEDLSQKQNAGGASP